ncbi:hypothetical protein HZF24_00610 [Sedimentibacter hydroxybenzoicus DSM 7310]|uniref:DUF8042 domain-containing protein n=1 Tax=Sedimentibacter hydroxybenzoicus DSM 7310 TaxID=1123245 RepID=A0A974BH75_SEDHY|nr:hypothetical protein [Sedimentibacter hydroxybenzoicus]NYB72635.1 hypothetical protein [Sedimentibacter hydroxybenzoicus DSM 7310]
MNIHIKDKVLECKNDPEFIEDIFNGINEYLHKEDLQFSHLIIDGEEIYDNFDGYIIEKIKDIKKIEVIALSLSEIVDESLKSAEQYSKNAIPIINKLAEEFYQKPDENTWSHLTDLFEGIQWIIQSLTEINSIESSDEIIVDYEVWDEYVQEISKFNDIVFELENAVLNKDNILIGDVLLYEIVPIFEVMVEKLNSLISEVDIC